jgi:hypothetical protein
MPVKGMSTHSTVWAILRKLHRGIPDSAPSGFTGAFISTKADAQIVAEVDSIDAWPAVEPRIHPAMSIAAIAVAQLA